MLSILLSYFLSTGSDDEPKIIDDKTSGRRESNIKTRIKSIVNFKKPAVWINFVAIIVVVIVSVVCLTNDTVPPLQVKDNGYLNTMINEKSVATSSNPYTVKTDYNKVKIKFLSDMMGFKNANEFETTDIEIVATIDGMMKSSTPYPYESDLPDLKNNNINQYVIEFSSKNSGYSCHLYYDRLYKRAYLEMDGGLQSIDTDYARYIDSLLENPNIDLKMDTKAVALYKQYGWTLDYKMNAMNIKLGDIRNLSAFEPNEYYFAYNNELSKDIGLDMGKYSNSIVDVEIYRIREEMPPASNPNKSTRGIVVKNQNGIIGAYISAGRHSAFSACSLKSNYFDKVTGITFNKWLESRVTPDIEEKSIVNTPPKTVIEAYFAALDKRDEKYAKN